MTTNLKIDLRKSDPLGLDFSVAYENVKSAVYNWKQMGSEDTHKPGWYEHRNERNRLRRIVVDYVALAKLLAQAIGYDKANRIPGLRFAIEFNGMS